MTEYYLISQLPSLDGITGNTPIPITEERFLELCNRFLDKKAGEELKKLTLMPSLILKKSSSTLIEAWNEGERNLRLAIGKARAEKMKKTFDLGNRTLPIEFIRIASTAVEMENPLKAEDFLFHYRLDFLETLRPMDTFSKDFIFYYGIKLKLILRMAQFDEKLGEVEYKNIYNSILEKDKLEAVL